MTDFTGQEVSPAADVDITVVGDWSGRLPLDKSSATRRHRIHQGSWRTDVARWPAGEPQNDRRVRARYPTLPNWLATNHEGRSVQEAGPNLMSPEARLYAKDRLELLSRIDGKAEPDRLWRNLLSSQPLAFSIAGHLHSHRPLAAELFGALTQLPVATVARLDPGPGRWADYVLDGIDAEWFPPRTEHTGDMSGCDIASCLALDDGRRVLVTIEVKYTDTFSPKPVSWTRYEEHLTALGLDEETTVRLGKLGCSQVLRQIMITDSVRRKGVVSGTGPTGRVDTGMAVVLARSDDRAARRAVEVLDAAVGHLLPVRFWPHDKVFAEAARIEALSAWANEMTVRYVPDVDSA